MSGRSDQAAAPESFHPADLAVLLLDGSTRVVAATALAVRQLGRGAEQLRGRSLQEIFHVGTDPIAPWMRELAAGREPTPPRLLELELLRPDGMQLGFEGVLYGIAAGPHEPGACVAGVKIRPSGSLVAKSELLMAQREVFALVASGKSLRDTLQAVAAFAERAMPGESFCLLSPIDAQGVFEPALCPTLPAEVAGLQAGHRRGESWSPATVAAESERSLLAHDVDEVESFRPFAARLQRHGLVASWAVPVRGARSQQVRAVLEFVLPVRRLPSRAEAALLDELGEMVRLSLDLHALASELGERTVAQQAAEETAQQRTQRMDALVDTALDAVIGAGDDGRITLWNRQAETLFGWRVDEAIGRTLGELIVPPELRKAHEAGLARAAATGKGALLGKRIEIGTIDRTGRRFPVELSICRMPGSGGGFSAFLRDISDRKRAEAAIKASEERLKLVIDASADGIWDLRLDGGASMSSDRCATMLGHDPALMVPCDPPSNPWVHRDDRASVQAAWQEHLAGATPRYESEHRRRAADGSTRWVLERAKVVERDAQGRVQRVVGVLTDVTERRALEQSLGSAERLEALGLLAGGFARELDELLSGIAAHATLTKLAPDLPERVGEGLEVVQTLVARAKSMARGLIGLAPHAGSSIESLVSAGQALREGLLLVRTAIPQTVRIEIDDRTEGRDLVRLDPAGLQQAMVHLTLRASESTGNTGRIVFRLSVSGRMLLVDCVDSARPMTPQQCAEIADALDARGGLAGRAALGMAAVRRFAETLGGSLRAEVRDEGNVVTLEIPREPEAVPVQLPPVLLCEDHPLLRPMLAEALTASGYRVLPMEQAGEIESLLRREGPGTVAILDARGWAAAGPGWPVLCERLGWNPLAVLLLDHEAGPLPHGVRGLRKPFALEALIAAVTGRPAPEGAQS